MTSFQGCGDMTRTQNSQGCGFVQKVNAFDDHLIINCLLQATWGKNLIWHLSPLTGAFVASDRGLQQGRKSNIWVPRTLCLPTAGQAYCWTVMARPVWTCTLTIYRSLIHGYLDIGWKQKEMTYSLSSWILLSVGERRHIDMPEKKQQFKSTCAKRSCDRLERLWGVEVGWGSMDMNCNY